MHFALHLLPMLLFHLTNRRIAFRLALSHSFSIYENACVHASTTDQPFIGPSPIFQGHFLGICPFLSPGHVLVSYLWWSPTFRQTQLKAIFHCHEEVLESNSCPVQETFQKMLLKWLAKKMTKQKKPPPNTNTVLQQGVIKAHLNLHSSSIRGIVSNST